MPDDGRTPRPAFAPWDRRELPGLFTVEESARRVGAYSWVEMRLFEALGGWIAATLVRLGDLGLEYLPSEESDDD